MKYLMTYAADSKAPPTPEKMAAIGKFGKEMSEAGVLLMTGGLVRPSSGTRLSLSGGKFTVTDGPYAETKELIDGFALIRANSMAEAIEHAQSFMAIAGDGEAEVLKVFDAAEIPSK
ncbi:MAG TPA: YciI family protein [Polyangiaceae bacterium]|nr:YciI family protein [Polyangiaceae bacterium]